MKPGIVSLVAVVGVLLVAGATTGTTHASWVAQRQLAATTVSSGALGLDAAAGSSQLTVARGASTSVEVSVDDASSGKNLVQRVTSSATASVGSVAVRTVGAGGCTTSAQPTVDLPPSGSFRTCVVYTAPDSTATSATVTVRLSGVQVRGGTATGWVGQPRVVTLPVTITQPANAPRGLGCYSYNSDAWLYWQAPASGSPTGYEVYLVSSGATVTSTSNRFAIVTEDDLPGSSGSITVGVRAVYAGGIRSTVNPTVVLVQNGSRDRLTCGAVDNP